MSQFNQRLQADIDHFRERLLSDPVQVCDPLDVHHGFVNGAHGSKLDFDKVKEGTDLYLSWVAIYARAVQAKYRTQKPDALVGIARGTNRLARDIGALLGIRPLSTKKVNTNTVQLDDASFRDVLEEKVDFAVLIEDVGMTGGTASTAVYDLRDRIGVGHVETGVFWQRSPTLQRLDWVIDPAFGKYWSVIHQELPSYTPEQCVLDGLCAQGVPLVPHGS